MSSQKKKKKSNIINNKTHDEKLKECYGLYKQAITGNINSEYLGMLGLKGKAEWEAWNLQEGCQWKTQ